MNITRQGPPSVLRALNSQGVIGLFKFPQPLAPGKGPWDPLRHLLERVHLPNTDTWTAKQADRKLILHVRVLS